MALPNYVAKHIQHKINAASLRANSLSQFISFHLSFNIASKTGDHRLLLILLEHRSNDALVSLLGYSIAILYSSYFSLLLSAPSVSNPPTSYSRTNHFSIQVATTRNPEIHGPTTRDNLADILISLNSSCLHIYSKEQPKIPSYLILLSYTLLKPLHIVTQYSRKISICTVIPYIYPSCPRRLLNKTQLNYFYTTVTLTHSRLNTIGNLSLIHI